MPASLTVLLAASPLIVLDGCDGTGKTTLAQAISRRHGHMVIHSGRTPDGTDIHARYRQILAEPGPAVLDRSFISELVYGPLYHGRSRLTPEDAASLARTVAARGGTLVHLTARPDAIIARLRSRDGTAPSLGDITAIIDGYHMAFALLAGTAPVITADTTSAGPEPDSPAPA